MSLFYFILFPLPALTHYPFPRIENGPMKKPPLVMILATSAALGS